MHTDLTRLLGIEAPIVQGSFGPWTSVALSAAVSEAGGLGGDVSTMALVPQVVGAIAPVPVLAAGGIADGRGLAAALALGAQG